jgi:hypothetical protein
VLADTALAETARLATPQITQLGAVLPGRVGLPVVLSVAELAAELRGLG